MILFFLLFVSAWGSPQAEHHSLDCPSHGLCDISIARSNYGSALIKDAMGWRFFVVEGGDYRLHFLAMPSENALPYTIRIFEKGGKRAHDIRLSMVHAKKNQSLSLDGRDDLTYKEKGLFFSFRLGESIQRRYAVHVTQEKDKMAMTDRLFCRAKNMKGDAFDDGEHLYIVLPDGFSDRFSVYTTDKDHYYTSLKAILGNVIVVDGIYDGAVFLKSGPPCHMFVEVSRH